MSTSNQDMHQADRDHKTLMQQVGSWNLANSLKSNMDFMAKGTGGQSMPFVGTYTDNSKRGSGVQAAALGALMTAGGLGAFLWSQPEDTETPAPVAAVTEKKEPSTIKPIIVEGVIDWEFNEDAGFNIGE